MDLTKLSPNRPATFVVIVRHMLLHWRREASSPTEPQFRKKNPLSTGYIIFSALKEFRKTYSAVGHGLLAKLVKGLT